MLWYPFIELLSMCRDGTGSPRGFRERAGPTFTLLAAMLASVVPPEISAREIERTNAGEALRVFLDCKRGCDRTFLQREITFISYVRDRADAEVHVLVTRQSSASGQQYVLSFHGVEAFLGQDQELRYNSPATHTNDERRRGMKRMLQLGLVPYVMHTPQASGIAFNWSAPAASEPVAAVVANGQSSDPWNYWVFSSELGTEIDGQERTEKDEFWGSFFASRTTAAWRMGGGVDHRLRDRRFEFDDGSTFDDISRQSGISAYAIKAIGDHWGVGGGLRARRSTFRNLERAYRVAGAIEYSVFPYAESSVRALNFGYYAGYTQFNYEHVTVLGLLTEARPNHGLFADYRLDQPWGNARVELRASQFMDDTSLYRLQLNSSIDFRVTRGFSINLWGRAALVRDQIYLPAGGSTDEDVLLGRRALDTGFETRVGVSMRYRFGSIYNSAVNVRLRGKGFTDIF